MREWACLSGRSHTGSFRLCPDERLTLVAYFRPPPQNHGSSMDVEQTHFLAKLHLSVVNNAYDGATMELIGETKPILDANATSGPIMLTEVPRLGRERAEAIQSAVEAAILKVGGNGSPTPPGIDLETQLPPLADSSALMKELNSTSIDRECCFAAVKCILKL